MIEVRNVTYSYSGSGSRVTAVESVSLDVAPGRMVAVLGANGSGKSTLARLMNGLLFPDEGRIIVDGIDTRDEGREIELRSSVGMVFQNPDDQIVATAVEDDVAFGPENLGLPRDEIRRRVDEAIAAVGLTGLERREPHLLSGGQKQRLAIAGALAMRPKYLVLDEPTAMIDSSGRRDVSEILRAVRDAGRGVLLITHDVAEAARADEVVVLAAGRIVFSGSGGDLVERIVELSDWGVEAGPVLELGAEMRRLGLPVPLTATEPEAIAAALWP